MGDLHRRSHILERQFYCPIDNRSTPFSHFSNNFSSPTPRRARKARRKHEIRKPKHETSPNARNPKVRNPALGRKPLKNSTFRAWDLFRISTFGFRICPPVSSLARAETRKPKPQRPYLAAPLDSARGRLRSPKPGRPRPGRKPQTPACAGQVWSIRASCLWFVSGFGIRISDLCSSASTSPPATRYQIRATRYEPPLSTSRPRKSTIQEIEAPMGGRVDTRQSAETAARRRDNARVQTDRDTRVARRLPHGPGLASNEIACFPCPSAVALYNGHGRAARVSAAPMR